jgi:hypothetical protein
MKQLNFPTTFFTIINMKFSDGVTKAFNKKPKKIGLQELVAAGVHWLARLSHRLYVFPPSPTPLHS